MTETAGQAVGPVCDAVCMASQLGRLDLVSALLAILGLLMALGGVFAFVNFRRIASDQARTVAEATARQIAEDAAVAHLQKEMPRLVDEYMELARNAAGDAQADRIARAQDDVPTDQAQRPT